jgi:hypothetical protein
MAFAVRLHCRGSGPDPVTVGSTSLRRTVTFPARPSVLPPLTKLLLIDPSRAVRCDELWGPDPSAWPSLKVKSGRSGHSYLATGSCLVTAHDPRIHFAELTSFRIALMVCIRRPNRSAITSLSKPLPISSMTRSFFFSWSRTDFDIDGSRKVAGTQYGAGSSPGRKTPRNGLTRSLSLLPRIAPGQGTEEAGGRPTGECADSPGAATSYRARLPPRRCLAARYANANITRTSRTYAHGRKLKIRTAP